MPSIIQHALAGEAILNSTFSIASILFPGRLLSSLVASESVPISTSAVFKFFGAVTLGMSAPMVLSIADSRDAAAKRKLTYATCSVIESALVSVVLWQTTQPDVGGFTFNGSISLLGSVVPALVWHLYVLLAKPQWFSPESAYVAEGQGRFAIFVPNKRSISGTSCEGALHAKPLLVKGVGVECRLKTFDIVLFVSDIVIQITTGDLPALKISIDAFRDVWLHAVEHALYISSEKTSSLRLARKLERCHDWTKSGDPVGAQSHHVPLGLATLTSTSTTYASP
ncbi:unnamed protein product [Fusarium equiseti]|uniref:Uncharacterized protein n=1 Tax=Fusarium equiseti TaxID=61235 RepID=A0A8J2NIW4_FUSEQ|nr:unnamed protein product [Fusarium equiseti]